eukprot:7132127-Prymnesium_polylepis.1
MSSYYVRHALQTIQVSPRTRGDLKNTQEHRVLVFLKCCPPGCLIWQPGPEGQGGRLRDI